MRYNIEINIRSDDLTVALLSIQTVIAEMSRNGNLNGNATFNTVDNVGCEMEWSTKEEFPKIVVNEDKENE